MSAIHDLLKRVEDVELRSRLEEEINKLSKQKKFGLVFEEHQPECTPLYEMPITVGKNVALKSGRIDDVYTVIAINGLKALCVNTVTKEQMETELDELVVSAQFGEPIYPYLKPIDSVCNAPDSDLWHTLIEADNYHALQLLEYLYAGKVDCIYIDPPYNTGAKDWKYNNDYVDSSDLYSHSKWLSMMEKRLRIAKKLLNPVESILMITIDDIELCHLRVLLDSLFPECTIQIVDMVINPKGKARKGRLSQVDEYLLLIYIGDAMSISEKSNGVGEEIRWPYLRRSDVESARGTIKGGTQQFYPVYVDEKTEKIVGVGEPLTPEQELSEIKIIEGTIAVFPIRDDGKHMNWGLTGKSLMYAVENGCVRVTKSRNTYQPYNFTYVTMPSIEKALTGEYDIAGEREDGTKIITLPNGTEHQKSTAWKETQYDANAYGTKLVGKFLGEKRFSFPKSLYSVLDALSIYIADKPNALVIDFFAGSGTTLHAVNILNAIDEGKRKCVLVTNNEVSDVEEQELIKGGYKPNDKEWKELGIARYVTWPRTVCSIKGRDVNGNIVPGDYGVYKDDYVKENVTIVDESGKRKKRSVYSKNRISVYPELEGHLLSDGFKANAVFFELGFLDKTSVALGQQFENLLPVLWMKAGAYGECPKLDGADIPNYLIYPQNRIAVLNNEAVFEEFRQEVDKHPEIETVYLVTDYEAGYRTMKNNLNVKYTYQLYRDYLDNFRINQRR